MVNRVDAITTNINMNGEPLRKFMYLGATLSWDGTFTAEVWIHIATAVMAKLKKSVEEQY